MKCMLSVFTYMSVNGYKFFDCQLCTRHDDNLAQFFFSKYFIIEYFSVSIWQVFTDEYTKQTEVKRQAGISLFGPTVLVGITLVLAIKRCTCVTKGRADDGDGISKQ